MYAFLSFSRTCNTDRGENKAYYISCYGGKSNYQAWAPPIKIEEMEFPWDSYRILTLWRLYVLERVQDGKVSPVKIWTPGSRFKRQMRQDYPLWITGHKTTWVPKFLTKGKTRTKKPKSSPSQKSKKEKSCKRLALSTLYARAKDFLDEAKTTYEWKTKYTPHAIKHMTVSK